MKFSEVIGQENIKRSLIYAAHVNRVPHALLFDGPEGTGKLSLAIAFAQYLNCEDKQEDDSCGRCISCLKYKKLIHPDLHFVFPIFKGDKLKAVCDEYISLWREIILESPYFTPADWFAHIGKEKGQGIIYSEEANEIIRKLNLKTFEAEYKCMIIWLPEKMHPAAANKVLKILEEPPDKTVFILITEESGLILPTMLSRCQVVKVPPIDDTSLYNGLSKQYQLSENESDSYKIKNAVMMAEGNFIKAAELLEYNEDNQLYLENFIALMRHAYSRNVMEMIDWSEKISRITPEQLKGFLNYMLKSVRENFMITSGAGSRVLQSPEEKAFSEKFHRFIHERNIFAIVEEIEKSYLHILRNGKPKIVFFDMALSIMRLIKA